MAKKTKSTEKLYVSPDYFNELRDHRRGLGPEPEHVEEQVYEVSGVIDGEEVTRRVRESQVEEYEAVFAEAAEAAEAEEG